jgi:hypothetical protein
MKIYLGPYSSYLTSTIHRDYMRKKHGYIWDLDGYKQTRFEEYLEHIEDILQFIYDWTVNIYLRRRKRKIEIKLHPYDSWNAFYDLSLIILPLLKQVKKDKHGHPWVDDSDAPPELSSVNASPKLYEYEWDDNCGKRWDYVLNEMIWVFEQIADETSDDKFFDEDYKLDKVGFEAWNKRKQNGLRLFGKFYENLWD